MKKLLLVACLSLVAVTAVSAQEFDGGDLRVRATRPANSVEPFSTNVVTSGYSNITGFTGSVLTHGGTVLSAGNRITRLLADDITPIGATAGLDVTSFTFSVANLNSVSVGFRPRVRFWNADGAGGAPGSYYSLPAAVGFSFNPVTLGPNSITLLTATLAAGQFTMPSTTFWAGMTFDNNTGGTGATSAQMNLIGQGLFDPPTVGSSLDVHFLTTGAGSFFPTANPAGTLGNVGGNPPANYGWEFNVDLPVPTKATSWSRIKTLYR